MRQLTINIPDYFKRNPETSLVNDSTFIVDEELLKELDERQKTPDNLYLTREESNLKLKQKK